jgi:hypothetical protein
MPCSPAKSPWSEQKTTIVSVRQAGALERVEDAPTPSSTKRTCAW